MGADKTTFFYEPEKKEVGGGWGPVRGGRRRRVTFFYEPEKKEARGAWGEGICLEAQPG